MTTPQMAVVRQCLTLFHASSTPDMQAIADLFSEDASYQSLVPRAEVRRGRERIIEDLLRQFSRYKECDCEILNIAGDGQVVFTERRDHVTLLDSGKRIFSSVNAVFELTADNRIHTWREYWDSGDVALQLGLSQTQLYQRLQGTPA